MESCGSRDLQDCIVADGFAKLQSCRVEEPQRYIQSLELQSYIITELPSLRVAEASQGIED